jgi:hypothetical protein
VFGQQDETALRLWQRHDMQFDALRTGAIRRWFAGVSLIDIAQCDALAGGASWITSAR